ncbi:50S ribosomal protein L22 [Planctomycetes bacterium Poly30]|uniref:Large ribosomal subunit protein uL22 n=1 Tax=Saltatorellus ferox TaxID=2528018 RepID=A0A518EWE2_9BACT|nr:50S ribosomal protein L22 [Planctomycetes bacterium Poly30]
MKNEIIKDLGGFVARHRYARISSRKARLVADVIRGRNANDALEILELMPQRGSAFFAKIVASAIANASLDETVDTNDLIIVDCRADDGPMLNNRLRYRPGPQGRAMPYRKKTAHLSVIVAPLGAIGDDAAEAANA